MSSARIGSPAWMNALKEHCFDHVDRLYADAGVKDEMSEEERYDLIAAEYKRREKLAEEQEAMAAWWRGVQRRNKEP